MRRRGLQGLAILLLAVAVVAALPVAQAHAVRLTSMPAPGQQFDVAPASVTITFTEPTDAGGTSIRVLNAAGERVDLQDATTTGGDTPTWRLSLQSELPDGPYRLMWQTLSTADGHVERGTVGFAIGDGPVPGSSDGDSGNLDALVVVGRALAFLGMALALGAAVFLAWMPGRLVIPQVPILQALGAGAAVHAVGVCTLLVTTRSDASIAWSDFLATSVGEVFALRGGLALAAVAFAAIALVPRMPARAPPYLAVVAIVAAGLTSARFGHASLAGAPGIAVDAIHLLAAATWVGGLLVFLGLLRGPAAANWAPAQIQAAGIRFGTAALVCVLALLAAGSATSLAILGPPSNWSAAALLGGTWGRALAIKLLLTAAMLALAVVNRYGILEPATAVGFAGGVQRLVKKVKPTWVGLADGGNLRRVLRVEATLGVVALVVAAMLTSVSPPSGAIAPAPEPVEVFASGLEYHASLTAAPGPVIGGRSNLGVQIATHSGVDLSDNSCGRPTCLTLVIGHNGTGASYPLQPLGNGQWEARDILWTESGPLDALLIVSSSDVFEDSMTFNFVVRAA